MGLNILSVAYPLTPVGPDAVGGSEQILTLLDRELVRNGHHSIVIAVEGSRLRGTLIPAPKWDRMLTDRVRRWAGQQHRVLIDRVLKRAPVDLVHMHSLDFYNYLPSAGVPVIATLHLPPSWYPAKVFNLTRPNTWVHCVSAAQRRCCPPSPLLLPTIPNGVDVSRFEPRLAKRNFAMALGRICPEKGFHIAMDAAKRAGINFTLAGQVFPYDFHKRYFRKEIVPRLSSRCRFIGPVGMERKRRLLGAARCLLIPSMVAETSSLVAMEAMASGTPVIAFPSGALKDIVDHGRTGFLVSDESEMSDAIQAAGDLDPDHCRAVARARYSAETLVRRYMEAYTRIIAMAGTRARTHFATA